MPASRESSESKLRFKLAAAVEDRGVGATTGALPGQPFTWDNTIHSAACDTRNTVITGVGGKQKHLIKRQIYPSEGSYLILTIIMKRA